MGWGRSGGWGCTVHMSSAYSAHVRTREQGLIPCVEQEQVLCQFAEDVFAKADAEDRAGKASKATAKTFSCVRGRTATSAPNHCWWNSDQVAHNEQTVARLLAAVMSS